jgi:hypothetical protein
MSKISNPSTTLGASKQNNKGVVTLMAVLVVGFTISAIIISSSLYSRLSIMNSKVLRENEQNKYFSEACIEKALISVRNNRSYVGTGNLSDGNYNCEFKVTNNGSNSRLIRASSTLNGLNQIIEVDTTIGNNYINIDYWKRVDVF